MSGPIVRGLVTLTPSTVGTATKVTVDQYGRVVLLSTADLGTSDVTGTLAAARFPALTGDVTTVAGQLATTITKLSAFTTNGFVKTSAGNGTITIDTNSYITTVDWANPGTIGSATPNTGAFTTISIGGPAVTELTVFTTSTSDPRGIMSGQYSTDTLGSRVHLRKARGTVSVPTTIVSGDVLGRIRFSGYDGSNFLQMASIDAISTGTVASTRIPTYLSFSVATDAAPSVLTEVARFTITGLNNAAVGATTPSTGAFTNLTITGGGYIRPSVDSTAAILFAHADASTIGTIDTTNNRFIWGASSSQNTIRIIGTSTANQAPVLSLLRSGSTEWVGAIDSGAQLIFAAAPASFTDANLTAAKRFSLSTGGTASVFAVDSATNTVTNAFQVAHNTSGTPAASFGTGIAFLGQSDTTSNRSMGRIRTEWTTATDASRASKMVLSTYAIGVETDAVTILSDGKVGIGVSPSTPFEVKSPTTLTSATIATFNNNAASTLTIGLLAANNLWQIKAPSGSLTLATNSSSFGISDAGITAAASNVVTTQGHLFTTGTAGKPVVVIRGTTSQSANLQEWQTSTPTTVGSISSIGVATFIPLDAATATVTNALVIDHSTSGTPAASYGTGLSFKGQSSTTVSRDMGRIRTVWTTATDASRKARSIWSAYDTAERDAIAIEASGSAAMIGVFSQVATPVVQPTVTGSRGGNAALASLLTALASIGWVVDSSSA